MYINCPVDIEVYDENETLVGKMHDNIIEGIEEGVGFIRDDNDQSIIILPLDMEFSVNLTAIDNGKVTYTVTEYNMDNSATDKVVSYYEIDIAKGDKLVGVVENLDHSPSAQYALYLNDSNESLTPTLKQSGDAVQQLVVDICAVGNGTVTGGGNYISGEFAKVTATANSGESFLGWYVDDVLISSDMEYRFLVNKNIHIVAKFTDSIHGSGSSGNGGSSKPSIRPVEGTTPSTPVPSASFVDVPNDAYYARAVAWAVEKGITNGTGENRFNPELPCTRAQIVTFLWRAAGSPTADTAVTFDDVIPGSYYYNAVQWAASQGIVTGTGAGMFSPNAPCTRAQAVTFLYRYEKSSAVSGDSPFTDVADGTYYRDAVLWATEKDITTGTSANTFSPDEICTRSQIVTFLYRDMA